TIQNGRGVYAIKATNSQNINISGNDNVAGVSFTNVSQGQITNNNVTRQIAVDKSNGTLVSANHLDNVMYYYGIAVTNGNNNQFHGNYNDGGWTLDPTKPIGTEQPGADDGIIPDNETGDTLQDNVISNFYDAGIETGDGFYNGLIANNTITNAGITGIGA